MIFDYKRRSNLKDVIEKWARKKYSTAPINVIKTAILIHIGLFFPA